MAKWVKLALGIVGSAAIFVGVFAFVYDFHPLGGGAEAYARAETCAEAAGLAGQPSDYCYDGYESELAGIESDETWIAVASGVASVGLFWLLAWLFYFRRRRTGQPTP